MFLFMLLLTNEDCNNGKLIRLYERYRKELHGVAYSILKDASGAEDVVHDTYLAVIDRSDRIDEDDPIKTWNYLATIAKHKCYNILKKNKRYILDESPDLMNISTSQNSIESDLIRREESAFLSFYLEQLNYPYKEVLLLKYYNEMSSRAIGQLLELSPANVRQLQRRALKKLRNCMKGSIDG